MVMKKIMYGSLIFCALFSFSAAHGEVVSNSVNNASSSQQAKSLPNSETSKTRVGHHKVKKLKIINFDLAGINKATYAELSKIVKPKIAKRIVDARIKLGNKFADMKELIKKAKLSKKQLKLLAKAFPLTKINAETKTAK